jgi:hypothetical protein
MGKRAEIQPAWLVSLLNQWARHDLSTQTGGLGFASGSSWMRGLKSSPASAIDPTGYAARDFRDVEQVMSDLMRSTRHLWAAVTMYYKPWVVDSFRKEGFPFNDRLYFARLHRAHEVLAEDMEAVRMTRKILAARQAA